MARHTFFCIDGHTGGNPVRLVAGGVPVLRGKSIAEKREYFMKELDWIRTGLMFEPRGHEQMSGSFIVPPEHPENDFGILFIETSGCLPMCGHGTIGSVTFALEEGLITPQKTGKLRIETPAGLVIASYKMNKHQKVKSVRIFNVPSFLYKTGLEVESSELGILNVDVAYGGNFYAIIDTQENFTGLHDYDINYLIGLSSEIRSKLNEQYTFEHPENKRIKGLSHVMWTGNTLSPEATARNAVFYGERAIDRSPCGTGTSARMAQWYSGKKMLEEGSEFIHESVIGSHFKGVVEEQVKVGSFEAIIPSIEGRARITGYNHIIIDDSDPYAFGFSVSGKM